jgi:tetratricopeptide (TPR) repeat protein
MKHNSATGGSPAGKRQEAGPRGEVERLIERGRHREAFKLAKAALQRQNTPENRRLVERTYLMRIDALLRGGMHSSAAEVAANFLEFGVNDAETLEGLVLILPKLGMSNQALSLSARHSSPEAQEALRLKVADEAVLHAKASLAAAPDIRQGAQRIRNALAAIERSNETEAFELLQEIPRNSPWADWRYFVRGLAAFYRHDNEQAAENWERLDPQRAASRIATVLKRALSVLEQPAGAEAGPSAARVPQDAVDGLALYEVAAFGEPLLMRLAQLQRHISNRADGDVDWHNDWHKASQILAPLRLGLRKLDVRLAQRLTEVLLDPLIQAASGESLGGAQRLVREFVLAAEPLALDPKWNRLWAILWEGPQGDAKEAVALWKKYLVDIEQNSSLTKQDGRRLQACVWRHIGKLLVKRDDIDEPRFQEGMLLLPAAPWWEEIAQAFEQSLQLDPAQRSAYAELIALYKAIGDHHTMAEVARRCLAAFPSDSDALSLLIKYHNERDEAEEMLRLVEQGRALHPLDKQFERHEYIARIGHARLLAVAGRIDEARAEMARCRELLPEEAARHPYLARRAAIEFRAGQIESAQKFEQEVRAILKDRAACSLALSIEAARLELSAGLQHQFQEDWRVALQKRPSSETVGQVARVLAPYFIRDVDYCGRSRHVADFMIYLGRTIRLKFRQPDLENACALLSYFKEREDLLETFLKKGLKAFPNAVLFHWLVAKRELNRSPSEIDLLKARRHLTMALPLAQTSDDPTERSFVEDIQNKLREVGDMIRETGVPPSFFDGFDSGNRVADMFRELMQEMREMAASDGSDNDDDDNDDDDDDDDESSDADNRSTGFSFGGPKGRRPPRNRK